MSFAKISSHPGFPDRPHFGGRAGHDHGFDGVDITAKSAAAASDMSVASDMSMSSGAPMTGKCNGCAGHEKGVAPAACAAFCGAVGSQCRRRPWFSMPFPPRR